MTILLYIPPVYKYASILFVSNHLKSVEKWNTTRDIILFYLIFESFSDGKNEKGNTKKDKLIQPVRK